MIRIIIFLKKLFSNEYLPKSLKQMQRITVFGIALAIMSLVLIVSASLGFKKSYKNSILNFNAHLVVMDAPSERFIEKILFSNGENDDFKWKSHIKGITPFIYEEALIAGGGSIRGVVIKGVDSLTMSDVNKMDLYLSNDNLKSSFESYSHPVILGKYLAENLNTNIGENVRMFVPSKNDFIDMKVAGLFESGLYDYDSKFLLMPINLVRTLYDRSGDYVSGIEVKLDDPELAGGIANILFDQFPEIGRPVTWYELNRDLFSAVKLEGIVSSILVGILVVVSAFNIITVLIIFVIYRKTEIAILASLGLNRRLRERLIMFGGLKIGLKGLCIGLILGLFIGFAITKFRLIRLPEDIYFVGALPIDISYFICLMVLLFGAITALLASVVASKRASKFTIVEALRELA